MSFRDAQNLPLQNISVTDLEAKVHGKPVKIVSLSPDPRPHRVVLVLDISGSMGSFERKPALWNFELSLARHFFEVNRERAQMALLFFNNRIIEVIDFTKGNSAVGDKLKQVAEDHEYVKTHIKGRTALRDAIFQAILLMGHPTSADAIYVLTDGADNSSHQNAKQLESLLAATSVRLFAVLVLNESRYQDRTPEEVWGPDELSEVALKSGGEILGTAKRFGDHVIFSADSGGKAETRETLARLFQTIQQDSLLEIELPPPIDKNGSFELKLTSLVRLQWKNVRITYPHILSDCNSNSNSSRN